jgi:ribonuclease P protein component
VRSGPLTIRYLPGDADAPVQVAYAIGRRVGIAVIRNRVRRRLRAHVRELERAGQVPPGVYLIGVAPGAADLDHHELGAHLARALDRVRTTAS